MLRNASLILKTILAMFTLSWTVSTAAILEKILVNFNGSNGNGPYGGLISDAAGNL